MCNHAPQSICTAFKICALKHDMSEVKIVVHPMSPVTYLLQAHVGFGFESILHSSTEALVDLFMLAAGLTLLRYDHQNAIRCVASSAGPKVRPCNCFIPQPSSVLEQLSLAVEDSHNAGACL